MSEHTESLHFIEQIVEADLDAGFSAENSAFASLPEPNGYLHIGHVKAIALNFNLGKRLTPQLIFVLTIPILPKKVSNM